MQDHWCETFFHGVVLDMWRAYATPEITRAEADFLAGALEITAGARVLDVPCGNGRHAIELASRGCRLTGVDLSADSIEEARRESVARGLKIDWRRADMRELPESGFDAAYCWGNSFSYLDSGGMREFCRALGRALRPGGRLAIETGTAAESILPSLQPRRWYLLGDLYFLMESVYHADESRLQSNYTFIRKGVVEHRTAWYTVLTAGGIRRMLREQAGIAVEGLFGGIDRQPFALGSPRLVLVGKKELPELAGGR